VGEFELKKGSDIKKIVQETIEIIKETRDFQRIKKIILFGSAVENKLTLMSDIDITVEFDKISKDEAGKFRKFVLGRVNKAVDVQVYNFLPEKIKREINDKGKRLYFK
jgi:predicted nucleotidyltransferase